MKMLSTKCRGHKARKGRSNANPLNELTLTQLFEVWSSTVETAEEHRTDEVLERIKTFVEEEDLAAHPVHLVRALIRYTSTCNDYVIECLEKGN